MQEQQTDSSEDRPTLPRPLLDSLARIATSAWTIRRKTRQSVSNVESGALSLHADAIFDALRQTGVEIEEYPEQPYRPGLDVEILVFQPNAGVEQDTITSTVRPAVLFQGQIIQRGQVIVSTPEEKEMP
jgi:hypothetical protein